MAEVLINNVVKQFSPDAPLAVDHVSMHVSDGEFLVLLGPSGCGKTTTLRMVAGLETATSGDIFIGEKRVNNLPPGARDIAFVFQFYALYPHLSVYDNIAFPLKAQRVNVKDIDQQVRRVAHQLKIDHILNRRPNRLPSGEQQRVALGRAMVRQPQVFLMDEPLTNLDAGLRAEMRVELKHLQQELNTTMLYVTHDQTEAMSMSHRIAVMNEGVLQQIGTPLDVYNHPATLFVARFIGSPPMNILPCTINGGQLFHPSLSMPLDYSTARAYDIGRDVSALLGVRAEDLHITTSGEQPHASGVIAVREPLGDETIYHVDLGDATLLVKTPPREVYRPGERVGLNIDATRIHLFDPATEQTMLGIQKQAVV